MSVKNAVYNSETNIFTDIFRESIISINPHLEESDISPLLEKIRFSLENEDLGNGFYERLIE
ncbi:MAG: hypothetical protein WCO29_13290 [Nostocales cyanobacterium ELA583]